MIASNWFEIKHYTPNEILIKYITDFFENIPDEDKLNEFLTKKRRDNPVPSRVDLELIAFSKEIKTPVISNDFDITFFAEELFERELSNQLYNFKELDFYNT